MKPAFRGHIDGDGFVAIKAEATLLGFLERDVALLTFFLEFGVGFDDLPGHGERVKRLRKVGR